MLRRVLVALVALGVAATARADDPPAGAATAPLRYPIGTPPPPDFLARGEPLTLTDFRYAGPELAGGSHAWLARGRFLGLGYVAAELEGERRGASFLGHRLSFGAWSADGDWALAAAWRAPRFVLSADGRSSQRRSGREWAWGPTLQVLVTPDVELYGYLEADTSRPRGRSLTAFGGGGVWQRGVWLEADLRVDRRYEITAAGDENRVDQAQAAFVVQAERAEVAAFGRLEHTRGRFPRRESEAGVRLRVPLLPRLLLEGEAGGGFAEGAGALRHAYSGRLTWFGRRFTLPRAGEAARRSLELARAAVASGEYETRVFDDDALRAQRERLSLSGAAPQLRPAMEAVYRAQLEERGVPLLGVGLRYEEDVFGGARTHTLAALVGMPWPPAWPWSGRERSVRFLTLELEHAWATTASHFRSEADRATLTVSLSREIDLLARYAREEPTAEDLVLGVGTRSRFWLECVYARGR